MLTALRLQNFKSFADAEVQLAPLTLLVGANASGKSNLLDALRFLQGMGLEDIPIDQVFHPRTRGDLRIWPGIRGGTHEAARLGTDSFTLETSWDTRGGPLRHTISCMLRPEARVLQETLHEAGTTQPVLEARSLMQAGGHATHLVALDRDGSSKPTDELSDRWSVLERGRDYVSVGAPAWECAVALQFQLQNLMFLDLAPARMREYVPSTLRDLGPEGENLSAVLFRLCQDSAEKQALIDWLSELCAPELADIDFSKTDQDEVMLVLVERDGTRISARSLSEGTLRFLGELIALRTAPEGSIVLLEEVGNSLHPQRAHLLVEYLESVTARGKVQIIATTHSPPVLQALRPETLRQAVVLGRSPDVAGTVMRRIGDLPHVEEVLKRRDIDYLFGTGWLERAL